MYTKSGLFLHPLYVYDEKKTDIHYLASHSVSFFSISWFSKLIYLPMLENTHISFFVLFTSVNLFEKFVSLRLYCTPSKIRLWDRRYLICPYIVCCCFYEITLVSSKLAAHYFHWILMRSSKNLKFCDS